MEKAVLPREMIEKQGLRARFGAPADEPGNRGRIATDRDGDLRAREPGCVQQKGDAVCHAANMHFTCCMSNAFYMPSGVMPLR